MTMTTFEPGRIYNVEQYGKQHLAIYRDSGMFVFASGGGSSSEFYRISGPLVVLDPDDAEDVADEMRSIGGYVHCSIADKITAQVKPPLQVGWHEVKELPHPMYFGGGDWRYAPSRLRPKDQSLTSTHYIGPASGDAS